MLKLKTISIPKYNYLLQSDNPCDAVTNGGLVIINSNNKITTEQLNQLMTSPKDISFLKFPSINHISNEQQKTEIQQILPIVNYHLRNGRTTVIYAPQEYFSGTQYEHGKASLHLADFSSAMVSIIQSLSIQPKYIILKGTANEIITHGLATKKSFYLGQVKPGITIWAAEKESRFPKIPYIIFPADFGKKTELKELVEKLA